MIRKTLFALFFLAIFLSMNCDGGNGGEVSADLEAYYAQLQAQVERQCDCYMEAEFSSRLECEQYLFTPPTPEELRCEAAALNMDVDGSLARLNCLNRVEQDYMACVEDNLDCTDDFSLDGCVSRWRVAIMRCPQLPLDINNAVLACY